MVVCTLVSSVYSLDCILSRVTPGGPSSVLSHCWLGSRKNTQRVKIDRWAAGIAICLRWRANELACSTVIPVLAHHLLLH